MTVDDNWGDSFLAAFREGTRLLQRGEAATAVPILERAVELDADNEDALLNLSGAYILTKKFRKAVGILERLRDENPENAMIWTNLGAAYLGNPVLAGDKQQRQAIAAFKEALRIDPAAPNVAYNIGLIYRDRRQDGRAISWFQRAIEINPEDSDALNNLRRLRSK